MDKNTLSSRGRRTLQCHSCSTSPCGFRLKLHFSRAHIFIWLLFMAVLLLSLLTVFPWDHSSLNHSHMNCSLRSYSWRICDKTSLNAYTGMRTIYTLSTLKIKKKNFIGNNISLRLLTQSPPRWGTIIVITLQRHWQSSSHTDWISVSRSYCACTFYCWDFCFPLNSSDY